jgi:hypothetical protein
MAKPLRQKRQEAVPVPLDQTMAGVLAMLVAEREERVNQATVPEKTEVILGRVGLPIGTIAAITGKQYGAVQMTISRSNRTKAKPTSKG